MTTPEDDALLEHYNARLDWELACIVYGSDACLACRGQGFWTTQRINALGQIVDGPYQVPCHECAGSGRRPTQPTNQGDT